MAPVPRAWLHHLRTAQDSSSKPPSRRHLFPAHVPSLGTSPGPRTPVRIQERCWRHGLQQEGAGMHAGLACQGALGALGSMLLGRKAAKKHAHDWLGAQARAACQQVAPAGCTGGTLSTPTALARPISPGAPDPSTRPRSPAKALPRSSVSSRPPACGMLSSGSSEVPSAAAPGCWRSRNRTCAQGW